jgi:hypothetical protein
MSELPSTERAGGDNDAELTRQIDLALARLAVYGGEDQVPHDIIDEIQVNLDARWEHEGARCLFSGLSTVVEVGDNPQERIDILEQATGVSDGFWVRRFGKVGKRFWGIALGFTDYEPRPDSAPRLHQLCIGAVDLAIPQYTVTSIEALEEMIPSVHHVLQQESDTLAELLNSADFFKLDITEQTWFVDSTIEATLTKCEELGESIVGRIIGLNADYGFIFGSATSKRPYESIETYETDLSGTCEGLVVLPRWQLSTGRKVQGADDLVDSEAGLCLAVRLDEHTTTMLGLEVEERLYIPMTGQFVEAMFGPHVVSSQ